MASRALRAIPEKEEVRSKIKEEEEREAEARPEDDKTEARREVVESLRTLLATQATLLDDDDIVTRAVDVTGSAATAATPFLGSS